MYVAGQCLQYPEGKVPQDLLVQRYYPYEHVPPPLYHINHRQNGSYPYRPLWQELNNGRLLLQIHATGVRK